MKTERKIVRGIFTALLIINFVIELVIGFGILTSFPTMAKTGFGITYSSEMDVLGIGLGTNLIFASAVILLSILWTMRSKIEGVILGIVSGGLFVLFSLIAFVQLGTTEALFIDGVRGLLTIIFGMLTYKAFKTKISID